MLDFSRFRWYSGRAAYHGLFKVAHFVYAPLIASLKLRQVPKIMYAIIETGGKQYRVQPGDVIYVEKLEAAENDEVVFDKVIAVSNDRGTLKVGKPYVKDAAVKGAVLKNGKGKKITVFTYKPKKGSSRKLGHRQPYTKVQINEIV